MTLACPTRSSAKTVLDSNVTMLVEMNAGDTISSAAVMSVTTTPSSEEVVVLLLVAGEIQKCTYTYANKTTFTPATNTSNATSTWKIVEKFSCKTLNINDLYYAPSAMTYVNGTLYVTGSSSFGE